MGGQARMNIDAIDAFTINLPFRFAFKHSLAERSSSTNLFVRVTLNDGTVGYGESIPRDYVTGETIDGAREDVTKRFAPQFIGADVSDPSAIVSMLKEKFRELGLESEQRGAAWCALE